ncbi:MAG TPA: hypothetical protein VK789_06405 [Bryobacteraceae bacterium]|nr:hypothetical protein [Bryobacteraceae bacterium]
MRWAVLIFAIAAIPAAAADHWTRLTTPGFELYTTGGDKKGKDTLRHFEQVREFFQKASPVHAPPDSPVRIVEFATEEQYRPYRPTSSASAYFFESSSRDYIVLGNEASYPTAIHEYMHLMVRHSGLKIPLWLNEGWADVYSTLRPMGKETAVGDLPEGRLQALTSGKWLSFAELTSTDRNSPNYHEASRAGIFYAESWALAHMLYLAPDYKDNFGKFVMALHRGSSSAEAVRIAWNRTPDEVFRDLQKYLDRKRIYGQIFEAGIDKQQAEPEVSAVPEFDSRLMLADLLLATNKLPEARQEYALLEKERPDRPDLARAMGALDEATGDHEGARRYFEKAFDQGESDPKMCLQLALLEGFAHQSPDKIIPILERAVKSKPSFTEAKIRLGLAKVDARDFAGAISGLTAIPNVTPEQAPGVFCGLSYAYLESGDTGAARQNAEICRKWAKAEADVQRADQLIKLANTPARERLQRITGTMRGVECLPGGNRLQIVAGNKLVTFDLPSLDAVETARKPPGFTLACGALQPLPVAVEFVPPRSVVETSQGTVRRLVF